MFRDLIESIRDATESSQTGGTTPKSGERGIYNKGPMVWHAGKQAAKKNTSKKRRQQGKKVVADY